MLDERLSMALRLYDRCELGADIGTDHGRLPAALLAAGICQRMILTDISPSALGNARQEMIRRRLLPRVSLRLGDGLAPLDEPCGVISILGMGGRTIRDILLGGQNRLHGAALILSAHTDWPLIRAAVQAVGYHLDREEPVFAAGRFYLVARAVPGDQPLDERGIRLGGPLFRSDSPLLRPYLQKQISVLEAKLRGLSVSSVPDDALLEETRADLAFYSHFLEVQYERPRHLPAD